MTMLHYTLREIMLRRERSMKSRFTPTEQRIFNVLKDQMMHTTDEIRGQLSDELTSDDTIAVHISHMRPKVRPSHEFISRRINGVLYYRYIRVIMPVEV